MVATSEGSNTFFLVVILYPRILAWLLNNSVEKQSFIFPICQRRHGSSKELVLPIGTKMLGKERTPDFTSKAIVSFQ